MGAEKITSGTKVMVSFSDAGQFLNDPARKYNGMEFVVKRKKTIMAGKMPRWYYELYGAESDMGIPYGFCEEDLIKL